MCRFILLAVLDFAVLILLASVFDVSDSTSIAVIACTLNPLAFPAERAAQHWPAHGQLIVTTAFVTGPLVWAAVVEAILRLFVDRSNEPEAE